MRNASGGKFSLGSAFGRKTERKPSYSGNDFGQPDSPSAPGHGGFNSGANASHPGQTQSHGGAGVGGNTSDDPSSPGPSGPGATFDGLGRKLGKTFAHQSLLPSLGNKDQRALQDVISAEKGVLNSVERLANESSKAAASLPPYGIQEGPDLHDILQQSSVLLNHLASSMTVFVERQASLRGCYKRIREREELLSDLRSRRRATGNKAETAEKKLAKMGPENKQLPSQTELLESLRQQMRSMDTEIVNEESRIGDFKRQSVKEALSYKFAGLEELGEKLCIIGELGKLVIEEIPLDETPPGYGRAPYGGFAKTESAVDEAGRCLSQVKFNPATFELKASHMPRTSHTLGRETLPGQESLAAAEEYGHALPPSSPPPTGGGGYENRSQPPYPSAGTHGNSSAYGQQPTGQGHRVGFALDDNPYGGLDGRYTSDNHAYREYGGSRPEGTGTGGQVVWQGPTEEALARQNGNENGTDGEYGRERVASLLGSGLGAQRQPTLGPVASTQPNEEPRGQDYEYAQQAEMDRQQRSEQAAWQEQAAQDPTQIQEQQKGAQARHSRELAVGEIMANPYDSPSGGKTQPLNIRRDRERGSSPAAAAYTGATPDLNAQEHEYNYGSEIHGPNQSQIQNQPRQYPSYPPPESPLVDAATAAAITALAPPPSFSNMGRGSPSIGDSGTEGFRTPAESPAMMGSEHVGTFGGASTVGTGLVPDEARNGSTTAGNPAGADGGMPGVPVIALAPETETGTGSGSGTEIPPLSHAQSYSTMRGSSPLPGIPAISDPAARGPSPRPLPLPEPGYVSSVPAPSSPSTSYSPTTTGKISAGAFRKQQPRRSDLAEEPRTPNSVVPGAGSGFGAQGEGSRRLPVPPGPPPQGSAAGWQDEKKALGEEMRKRDSQGNGNGNVDGEGRFEDAPPGYSRGEDSLR